ncbi:DUF927 domain-containing protein [Methanosarcina mazei]|uniref:DUF927 domain-containing protein n=1 Tax=Methanosarcina mazei TaxID=2209 RepID=A0A0F8JR67_METMZ|nr:DUF927 domain-containing protein [Methanosarcina mazei]KKG71325.1 hypothetical protein DU46_18895 [Methanosarcina mazei]KKG83607.1 hypothetical protein DU61_17445 [Methanosarcina mazei]KKH08624.1 hypothetical protein DU62_19710 [Methanosarcina mazei]KKH11189.1 hypothetical protein DU51_17160 [Methanosarcina mazei]
MRLYYPPYKITDEGIFEEVPAKPDSDKLIDVRFCDTPCRLIATGDNVDTGETLYKISVTGLKRREKIAWKKPKDLLTRDGIISMYDNGMIFEEKMAPKLMSFFSTYIRKATPDLKEELTASRSGWKQNNSLFIVGSKAYTGRKEPKEVIQLENNTADLYTQKGSIEGWKVGAEELLKYDAIRFKAYAACTPLILSLIGVPSFLLEQIGKSGILKTLSSMFCASMYGNPVTLQINAKSTPKGIEAFVGYNTDLPVFIDETSTNEKEIKDMIYTIANGIGRSTSNKSKGYEMPKTWLTVVMTTGENPILPTNAKLGEFVRNVQLRDGVTEQLDQNTVSKIEEAIQENHGLLRDLIIKEIFENKDSLKATYRMYYEALPDPDEKNITCARAKKFYAAIATAGYILETVFCRIGLKNAEPLDIVNKYYTQNVIDDSAFIPDHERAFEAFQAWFAGNRLYFEESEDGDLPDEEHKINHERYGWIRAGKIQITPTKLEQVITQLGYNYKGCVDNWKKERKYLDGRSHKKNGKEYTEYTFELKDNGIQHKVFRIPYNQESNDLKDSDDRAKKGKMPVLHIK